MVGAWVRKATGLRCNLHIGLLILALAGSVSAQERTYWYPTGDLTKAEALGESRTYCAVLFDALRTSRQALVGSVIGGAAVSSEPVLYRPREGVAVFRIVGSFADAQASLRKGVGQNGVTAVLRVFDTTPNEPPVIEWDRLLIGFRPGADRVAIYRKYGLDPVRQLVSGFGDIVQVRMQSAADIGPTALANQLVENERGSVEFAHVDYLSTLRKLGGNRPAKAGTAGLPLFRPDDPLYSQQWHLSNTGQGGGTVGADVKAETAWDISRGSNSVIIAVIDDCVDITHEDLNVGGKIVSPRDVSDGSSNPGPKYSDDGHGTCVSGVATAAGNNNLGVTGIAPNCRLMPIRMDFGGLPYSNIVDAFDWARAQGAWCANNSWYRGSGTTPAAIAASIQALATTGRGGLGSPVLFASGNYNGGYGIDTGNTDRWWPQNLSSAVWCVGATTNFDLQCDYSDTGDNVQIMTPSGDGGGSLGIMTTDNMGTSGYAAGNYYDHFNGTSSACPLATGIVALIMSVNPALTRGEVLGMLTSTAKKLDPAVAHYDSNGHSRIYGYGRADAGAALTATAATLGVKVTVSVATSNTGSGGRKTDSANPITVSYTLLGRTRTGTVFDGTPAVLSCDRNSTVTFPAATTGSAQRWARAAAYSYSVGTTDCTVPTVSYYHQLKRPFKVVVSGATGLSADNTVTTKYTSLATEQTLNLADTTQSVFADTGSQVTFQTPSSKSGDTERWVAPTAPTVTVNSTTTECTAQFYHQVAARVRLNGTSADSYVATSQRTYFGKNDDTTKQSRLYGIYQAFCDSATTLGFEPQSTGSPLLAATGTREFQVASGLDAQVNYLVQARYDTSTVEVSRTNATGAGATVTAPANGRTAIRVTVTVKDSSRAPLAGVSSDRVDVYCTPNDGVTIAKPTATTDSTGRLFFDVTSQQPGQVTLRANLDGQQLTSSATAEWLAVMTMRVPQAGAYLVTFPITPADTSQTIADFNVTPQPAQLAWWNHDTGVYDIYRPGTRNETLRIQPGKGYFLRTDAAGTIDLTGTHVAAGTTTFPLVASPKGFHLLGNPKESGPMIWSLGDFEVVQGGVSRGRLSDSANWNLIDPMAWSFNGRTYELVADALFPGTSGLRTQIAVFEGFYWYAKQDGVGIIYHADHSRAAARPEAVTAANFGLTLVATAADVKATVLVGSRSQALRVAAAPVAPDGDDLRLDVVNSDGTRAGADLIGQPVTQATNWIVKVTTRATDRDVVLTWPQLTRQLPAGFRARLLDLNTGQSLLLNTHTTYTYRSNGERQFRLTVAPQREAGLQIVDFQPAASRGRSVSFRATVTGEAELYLRVLSLNGRAVAEGRPVTGSGDTALVWDGLDSAGRPVPRGTYQVQLVARNAAGETVRATRIVNIR